ncbi:3-hydroxyacyl-ACP dehydratase [Danxiaibacter flavus]|uniref:3-hydroxyacyl-ACP dehydratase n=1 Tax=Danxiaibacter flavus TaxID=3049108 RepID=A0ABV3ZFY9_9BACT|nr:3-hydroxyacyl-ACP dehydratase [Chitinophagaceae bacterium DXS]
MLKDDFYHIIFSSVEADVLHATLTVNSTHRIFQGHFPGQPVVPGACLLQIVKELTELAIGRSLRLIKADDLKFLSIINPNDKDRLAVNIHYSLTDSMHVKINATILKNEDVCFKCKATLL